MVSTKWPTRVATIEEHLLDAAVVDSHFSTLGVDMLFLLVKR